MPEPDIPDVASRGRPRSQQVEAAILRAAAQLLAERGLDAMTIEDVASLAGVGKASVYRRWPTKGFLALDAFLADFLASQPPPASGSFEGDLIAALRAWVRTVRNTATGRALVGLVAQAQHDPGLAAAWRARIVEPTRAQHLHIIQHAVARGEIPPDSDPDVIIDMLYGPAYHRLLQGHLPLTDKFVKRIAAIIAAGVKAGAATPR
jgi:AcrR family transcriptional regulator